MPHGDAPAAGAPSDAASSSGAACDAPALVWDAVCYRVGRGRARKWLLAGVSVRICAARAERAALQLALTHAHSHHRKKGYATPGRLLAIMGPSGCGKSTLLNALSARRGAAAPQRRRNCTVASRRPRSFALALTLCQHRAASRRSRTRASAGACAPRR
jgi:hypothetical protein